jgi:hypothetical protein
MEADAWLPDAARLGEELGAASKAERIFAVIDGARVRNLPVLLGRLTIAHASLFRGGAGPELQRVGPYLAVIPLDRDPMTLFVAHESILDATLFLVSPAEFEPVRTHLRRFLRVLDTEGRYRYFRFYDPRVLPVYLGSSEPLELAQLFGPIRRMLARSSDPDTSKPLLLSWEAPEGVAVERFPDVNHPLRLRPEHEAAFAEDMFERYQRRVVDYLRQEHSVPLAKMSDPQLRAFIGRAREQAPQLRLSAGRDVTLLAEMMALGLEEPTRAELDSHAWYDRPRALQGLRDKAVRTAREQALETEAGATPA